MTNRILVEAWNDGRKYVRDALNYETNRDPKHPPYGCYPLHDNSFAAACYNDNALDSLDLSKCRGSDATDRKKWGLSPSAWARQIGMAYEAMTWDQEHEMDA